MKPVRFAIFLVLLCLFLGCRRAPAPAEAPETGGEVSVRPSWLGREPLIIAGNWDSMPIFRRRVGGNPAWQEEDYAREHTEETVRKLKELGVTMAIIHFYKGFGLAAEKEHMDEARQLAALLKKHGLRVGVYVGSTIAYETFLAERPEAEEWFVPPYLGRPVVYGGQTFRKRVYFMHPGYRGYMREVVRLAVQEFKADLVHFDNTSLQAQAPIFFHPQAVEDFRAFLRRKYSREMLKKRFGFAEVRFIEPPADDRPRSTIDDPLWQEWADFRCEQLAAYYGEMARYIRRLNPETAVECNPHSGISGRNTVWEQGVDYPRLLAHTDVVWTEEGNPAGVNPDGILVSKIRTYKMAAALGNSIFTYTGGMRGAPLQMAEAMAYNRQNLGMVGGVLAGYEATADERRYIDFYRKNFDYYRGVTSGADVAVFHSYASLAYNNDQPWQSTMLAEQALIQAKAPFDIVFDRQLEDLSRYRVLVLADQESLSDEQIRQIEAFVRAGGGLVATGQTSLYTEWRQRRREPGLKALVGPGDKPVRREEGKGRVAYLPAIQPAIEKPPAAAMTSQYWKLPKNWEELVGAVKWAAGGELPLEVKGPLTVTAELLEQKASGRLLVHLLNYDAARRPDAGRIEFSVRLPAGKSLGRAQVISPDEKSPQPLACTVRQGRAACAVANLKTYSVAVLPLQ
jgi:hypothetical protein